MTLLPTEVRVEVEAALAAAHGRSVLIGATSPVGGGCINPAARVETDAGTYFLKWNPQTPGRHFMTEGVGLDTLRASGSLRIPTVISTADPDAPLGWLLLEFIDRGPETSAYWSSLGHGLAELHAHSAGPEHGGADNLIGPLPQENRACLDWPTFWWERRLLPQLKRATSAGYLGGHDGDFERLRVALPNLLGPAGEEGYSVLHGDLWSGNVFPDPGGQPVLVDPSVYRGHREVDLAMTELFGGFKRGFYGSYNEAWPLLPTYESDRRDVYQLYPLLVHLNLFGASYEPGVRKALGRIPV